MSARFTVKSREQAREVAAAYVVGADSRKSWEVRFDLIDPEGWPFDCAARGVRADSIEELTGAVRKLASVHRYVRDGYGVELTFAVRETRPSRTEVVIP